jgi:hypothetical protein
MILERFPAKWIPVREKKTRQNKEIEPPFRFNRNGNGSSRDVGHAGLAALLIHLEAEALMISADSFLNNQCEMVAGLNRASKTTAIRSLRAVV